MFVESFIAARTKYLSVLGAIVALALASSSVNAAPVVQQTWDFEGPTGTLHDFTEVPGASIPGDGTAFNGQPLHINQVGDENNVQGNYFVRSDHNTTTVPIKHGDSHTGILESGSFVLGNSATFDFLIGGGNHPWPAVSDPDDGLSLPAVTALNLERLVGPGDWEVAISSTSTNTTTLAAVNWDASAFAGDTVRLRIYDTHTSGWGHVAVDNIVYTIDDGVPPPQPLPRETVMCWDFEGGTLHDLSVISGDAFDSGAAGTTTDGVASSPVRYDEINDSSNATGGDWFVRSDHWKADGGNGKHNDGPQGVLESSTFTLGLEAMIDFQGGW